MSEAAYHELICKDEPTPAPDSALALNFRHGCTCAVGREEFKALGGPDTISDKPEDKETDHAISI